MTFPRCQCGRAKATHERITGERLCTLCFREQGRRIHEGLSPVPLVPEPLPALVCVVCTTVLDTTELRAGMVLLDGKPTCEPCGDDIIRTKPDAVFTQTGTKTGRMSSSEPSYSNVPDRPRVQCTPEGMKEYDKREYECATTGCLRRAARFTPPGTPDPAAPHCDRHGPMIGVCRIRNAHKERRAKQRVMGKALDRLDPLRRAKAKLDVEIDKATANEYPYPPKPPRPTTTPVLCHGCDKTMAVRSGALEPQGITTDDEQRLWHVVCLKDARKLVTVRKTS